MYAFSFLIKLSVKRDSDLSKLWPAPECMYIPVYEISVSRSQHGIQPYAFRDYRILDIFLIHFTHASLAALVESPFQMLCIVDQGITLGHSKEIFSKRSRDDRGIPFHSIRLRIISLKKDLKLSYTYEIRRIRNY